MRALPLVLLAACGAASLTLPMNEQNNSGQTGSATLTDTSEGLSVTVTIKQSGFMSRQTSHIHAGRCDDVRGVEYGISQVDGGEAAFQNGEVVFHQLLANVSLKQLLDGGEHVINVHDPRDISLYVSCGEIK